MSCAKACGNSGTLGDTKRGQAGSRLREKAIGMAVVAASEFDEEIAIGHAAGQTQGAHGGFGAAGDEPDFLQKRNRAVDERRELEF